MRKLLLLVLIIMGGLIVSNTLSFALWYAGGLDITTMLEGSDLSYGKRQLLRVGLMINHIGMFLLPGVIYCLVIMKTDIYKQLKLDRISGFLQILMWAGVILLSYPILMKITEWNASIPLPEWMASSQESNFALIQQTLNMSHISELLTSLVLVGALAAVGEELIFRGIVQNQLNKALSNPHVAIIIASLIFGGFHMQFERLLPLSFLGLIMGYSYYYTKSLWTPIILHFINNGLQVLAYYVAIQQGELPEIDNIPSVSLPIVLASLFLTAGLAYITVKTSESEYEPRP